MLSAIALTLSKSPGEAMAKPASMHVDAQFGQRLGHADLLVEVHREAGRLLAVAQRGVEDDDAVVVQLAEAGMVRCSLWSGPRD